jgi:hypothetical protein
MHCTLTGRTRRQRRASGPRRRARVRQKQPPGGAGHPKDRRGRLQTSPVLVGVDGEGKLVISTREGAYKTRNLRRDPTAVLCVFSDRFLGRWIQIEGTA